MKTAPLAALLLFTAAATIADDTPTESTLGAKPPADATVLLADGAKSLDAWVKSSDKAAAKWPVEDGVMTVGSGQGDIQTIATFGDFVLHLEFQCPYEPGDKGQARGNSGVYLTGKYELQILDSYGLIPAKNDCGAIYNQIAPRVNACKPPLQWQTYDVTFRKAKVVGGKVVEKAHVTVRQNGILIIDDAAIDVSPGGAGGEAGTDGPLLLQDHGDTVQYRNIWIQPAK